MKLLQTTSLFMLLCMLALSCTRQELPEKNPAVLEVFNGLERGTIRANLSGIHPITYQRALGINNRRKGKILISEPVQELAFYADPDTLAHSTPVWNSELELTAGKLYILFLFGKNKPADHILLENNYPVYNGDSLTHARFANLADGPAVSVNLKGSDPGSLADGLASRAVSGFTSLEADRSISVYEFEFRDAATGELLETFQATDINAYEFGANRYLYQSWTLVITGSRGGTGTDAFRVTQIFHQ